MASARQCLQARPQAWVISQYTNIGFLEKSWTTRPILGVACETNIVPSCSRSAALRLEQE
jgi:hypothetical protein